MLKDLWLSLSPSTHFWLVNLTVFSFSLILLWLLFFQILRPIFRRLEQDIALVTLNISAYPFFGIVIITNLKLITREFNNYSWAVFVQQTLNAIFLVIISYWFVNFFKKVFIYYLKQYTKQTEVMWDDVLLPLVEAVIPVLIFIFTGVLVLNNFGLDLTGIWVALGGATFIIGFAVKDILANFFSGIVLLIDTPFRFGDVLRLENGSIGMLLRIGVRVTQIYLFDNHCNIYIPNSVLQNQNITNLSRPTSYYYYSTDLEIPTNYELNYLQKIINEVVLAHPDTLADIDSKLEFIEQYFFKFSEKLSLQEQQEIGKNRLIAEQKVNLKLEEIEYSLEALVITLQFAEKGGLTTDEISNIQEEYENVLYLIGLKIINESEEIYLNQTIVETQSDQELIELIRSWYRIWLKDPNLQEEDQYLIPQEWERKINLLKKRTQKLYQKIVNPRREETRLDDYVLDLSEWFESKFKERKKWQNPQIWIKGLNHDEGFLYYQFELNFFVDDIKLEYGKRGDRIASQIYQEILKTIETDHPQSQSTQENINNNN